MEEEVDSNGQEEQGSDDPALPGPNVEAQTNPQYRQETSTLNQDLPIMHWEDLSLRIAELEKKEDEKRKRISQSKGLTEQEPVLAQWTHVKHQSLPRKHCEDEDSFGGCRFPFITSRFNTPKNLQLCFINNSESEEEDDEGTSSKKNLCGAADRGRCCAGLKQEVRAALSELRDKLWAEQRQHQHVTCNDMNIRRKMLNRSDLQTCSMLQLNALSASLNEDIQDLSSELVKHLVVRDHLRTKQDAMLLDVQDMT